jgi:hypothetical protein
VATPGVRQVPTRKLDSQIWFTSGFFPNDFDYNRQSYEGKRKLAGIFCRLLCKNWQAPVESPMRQAGTPGPYRRHWSCCGVVAVLDTENGLAQTLRVNFDEGQFSLNRAASKTQVPISKQQTKLLI